MRILVDATPLLLQSAGVKGHLFHWIRAMRAAAGTDAVDTWPGLAHLGRLDHSRSQATRWETWIGIGSFLAAHHTSLPVYEALLPRADVFHACIMQTRLPRKRRVTATVFDVTPLIMPQHHTAENVRAFRAHSANVLRHAHSLIAISEHSRNDAIEVLGIDPDRIETIHSIVDGAYFETTAEQAEAARKAYGLRKPFVLVVGTIEPRKNIDRLLDAWQALSADLLEHYELVLAGSAGWGSEETVARLKSGQEGVRWLGYVREEDLPGLTKAAELLAYPSLYEGFGLPAGQALASGTAVLTSNVSSIPEVVGAGGLLVDPMSTAEITAGIARLLDDAGMRERLASQGREHVRAHFTADVVGRASLRFFERAVG